MVRKILTEVNGTERTSTELLNNFVLRAYYVSLLEKGSVVIIAHLIKN